MENFLQILPFTDVPYEYVVFKPLSDVDMEKEEPKIIVFYANPDQLSALVVLANYGRTGNDNAVIPFAAGCQSCCLLPLNEAAKEQPQAVVGMLDISHGLSLTRICCLSVFRFPCSGKWRIILRAAFSTNTHGKIAD